MKDNKVQQAYRSKEKWFNHAVIYQIYPRSFKDSNGDGIGDLSGIIEKLDYLNDGTEKSLGIDAIWLNPIYKSPQRDFGYDVSDYYAVDPVFGDLKTFDRLIGEAHQRNIKVLMDFVPNHTSSEHSWFIESRSSKGSIKRDWYIWRDPKQNDSLPNNWLSVFGGPAWTYDEQTEQFYMHSFLPEQPDLNWRNPEVQKEMLKVLKFWLERKVDGFRIDSVYHLAKDSEFRDDPPNPNYAPDKDDPFNGLLHTYSRGRPELFDIISMFCSILDQYEDKCMVSEASEASLDITLISQLCKTCKYKNHVPFNFNFLNLPFEAKVYKQFIDALEARLAPDDIPAHVFGNHDVPRVASRLGQQKARLAAMLLFTLRGMAFVYYGDELGMENAVIPPDQIRDPWGRNLPGFQFGRDRGRTPMQWDGSSFAGFSSREPWLPFLSHHQMRNVETESKDPQSMFSFYRQLIHFRKQSPALLDGAYRPLESDNPYIFSFMREHPNEKLITVLNFSGKEQKALSHIEEATLMLNTHLDKGMGEQVNLKSCILRPYEGYICAI